MIPNPETPLIGLEIQGITLDIRYTPIPDRDIAHADLTFTGPIPAEKTDELKKFLLALPDYFLAIHDSVWFTLPDTALPGEPPKDPSPAEVAHRASFITEALARALRAIRPKEE
jgi:hypothetical protein